MRVVNLRTEFINALVNNDTLRLERLIDDISFVDDRFHEACESVLRDFPTLATGMNEQARRTLAENMLNEEYPQNVSPPARVMIQQPTQAPGAPPRRRIPQDDQARTVRRRLFGPEPVRVPEHFTQENVTRRNITLHSECEMCGIPLSQNQDEQTTSNEPVCMVYRCGHVFHCECINSWKNYKETRGEYAMCPKCRGPIQSVRNIVVPRGSSFGKRPRVTNLQSDIRYLKSLKKM